MAAVRTADRRMQVDKVRVWGETPLQPQFPEVIRLMAHHPMFEPDPENSASAAGKSGYGDGYSRTGGEDSELAQLAAKFTVHGGGRLSPELSADLALELVLNEIVEQACLTTGASGAAIVVKRGDEWVCRATAGNSAPELGSRLDGEAGLSGACVKTREVQRCDDAQNDPRADMEACRNLGVRSVLILPLLLNQELVGVFEAFSSLPSAFRERDERTLEALSHRALQNIERASAPLAVAELERSSRPTMAELIVEDLREAESRADSSSATIENPENFQSSAPLEAVEGAGAGRGLKVVTWILSLTVVLAAIVLTVLAGVRLTGRKIRVGAHAPVASRAAEKKGAAPDFLAPDGAAKKAQNESSGAGRGDVTSSPVTGSPHATSLRSGSAAAGGLAVYEKGKEIFRLAPSQEGDTGKTVPAEINSGAQAFAGSGQNDVVHRVGTGLSGRGASEGD